jgi:hypothetical protein
MFIDFEGLVSAYSLSIIGAGEKAPDAHIDLTLTLGNGTIKQLGFDNGDDVREAEPSMLVKGGDPAFANGEPIQGGCGALWHIPAYGNNPVFLVGLAFLPQLEFERIWRILSTPSGLQMSVNASVGHVPFSSREGKWIWETNGHESSMLLIRDVTMRFSPRVVPPGHGQAPVSSTCGLGA